MATTYLDLCNRTLRRLNEVEIQSADFGSVRNVQAIVKDAVNSALAEVNRREFEWPWNYEFQGETTSAGQWGYQFPSDVKTAEWDSFILKDGDDYEPLLQIDRQEWYNNHRAADYEAGTAGRGRPKYVLSSSDFGFTVTPSPDDEYTIYYNAYVLRNALSAAADTTTVPDQFSFVIVEGALYHMYMHRDNIEQASVAQGKFEQGIKEMQSIYINQYTNVYSTVTNHGGQVWRNRGWIDA